MRLHDFRAELRLPLPPEELFPVFADAGNLDVLTPPWLHFRILTPGPFELRAGSIIDCRIRVRGLPLRWRTLIAEWAPPHRFVDVRMHGPFRRWVHTHTFEEREDGTVVRDRVQSAVPLGLCLHRRFVRPDLDRIFTFRRDALEARFGVKR